MQLINNNQKENILKTTNEINLKIETLVKEIDGMKELMEKLCDEENINVYYTISIKERLIEAKTNLQMSQIRIEEFQEEANSLKLSKSGFY